MKSILYTFTRIALYVAMLGFAASVHAQTPQAFNYQGVARNASGAPLNNQAVSLRLSVRQSSASGPLVYQETHAVTTNAFGLFSVKAGTGTVVSGSFGSIAWQNGNYFMEVEIDPTGGNNYTAAGTPQQLISVPYAMHAKTVENDNDGQTLAVSGSTLSISGGNSVTLPDAQTLSVSGNTVSISGGNSITLPAPSVIASSPLGGNGTISSPLTLAQAGAQNGDVLKWTGSGWTPQPDVSFQLPYTATHSSGSALFNLTNNTTGAAIRGSSASVTNHGIESYMTSGAGGSYISAMYGFNQATSFFGIGVYGRHAASGWGVYGKSDNGGVGVMGEAAGNNGIGIRAYYTGTSGVALLASANSSGGYAGIFTGGFVGMGVPTPQSQLDIAGGQWDLANTEGDFRIGDISYRLKIGISTGGGGAGDVFIRAAGGTNRIFLGGNNQNLLTIDGNSARVGIGATAPTATLDVVGGPGVAAIKATAASNLTPAVEVSGAIKVTGSAPAAFLVIGQNTTPAANGYVNGNTMIIDSPLTNNDPNALVIVTHNYSGTSPGVYVNKAIGVYYIPVSGRWAIYTEDVSAMPLAAFNVLVIKR
jgi:hypothetical protein